MTMPEKITAFFIEEVAYWNQLPPDDRWAEQSTPYIRADIVEELARVLDDVTEVNSVIDMLPIELVKQVDSIIARINAIMDGK